MSTLVLPYPSTHPDLCHGKYVAGLFANGEQGAWYDPSDLSTMYQDAIGATVVTAVGQPVGLILDKSKGAIRGPELLKDNLLYSGTLNSGWSYQNLTFTSASVIPKYSYPTNTNMQLPVPGVALNKFYEVRFSIVATSGNVGIAVGDSDVVSLFGFRGTGSYRVIRPILSQSILGIVIQVGGTGFVGSITIESVREVLGSHATKTTTANRPTLQIDTAGNYYLSFDGVDDSLVTGNINFTATDKMTVMAGVRKLSDAEAGIVVELSADRSANAGAFSLYAPAGGTNQYLFGSRGTVDGAFAAVSPKTYPTTQTAVLTGIGNISGDQSLLRVNGSTAATAWTIDQGTGNFGNYPLYIGRRNGASMPFKGHLYGLIVRGAATDDLHLTHAEKYLAYKSGVSL